MILSLAVAAGPVAGAEGRSVVVAAAASCPTGSSGVPTAISRGATNAAGYGVTEFVSVRDRSTGRVLGSTANSGSQVASESIMKLLLATYYLVLYGGYSSTPQSVKDQLSFMLRYSDDATANALFSDNAIPTMAARYNLGRTTNATDRPGHWGAARITASDMTYFLYRAQHDPAVGPWLIPVMAQTAPTGSDGFNQAFGLNAQTGTHGSKQGWGDDSFFTDPTEAIHSVGYTSSMFVSVLQLGSAGIYPDPMRSTATYTASLIRSADPGTAVQSAGAGSAGSLAAVTGPSAVSSPVPTAAAAGLPDGTFVRVVGTSWVYRLAGGAPIFVSTWTKFGGPQRVTVVSSGLFASFSSVPRDGTYLKATTSGRVYRVAGGAALWVSSWNYLGGRPQISVRVDDAAINHPSRSGPYSHLRPSVADGTFVRDHGTGQVYRVVGGAPLYVQSWTRLGGPHPFTDIDGHAFSGTRSWPTLRRFPADGTFLRAYTTHHIYRVAGGAPLYVPNLGCLGLSTAPMVDVDAAAIYQAGRGGAWNHLVFRARDGVFLRAYPSGRVYRVSHNAPFFVASWTPYGGPQPTVTIPAVTIDRAGTGSDYNHLARP